MEYKVEYSDIAKKDLFDIYYFVAINDSFELADKLRIKLEEKCLTLYSHPKRGSRVKEISEERTDLLQIIYKSYRIIYKVLNKNVTILSILDGRRNIESVLSERFLN